MADTRKHDLEELGKARESATTTQQREHYDKISAKIRNESYVIRENREKLVQAVRNSDARAVRYFQEEIRKHDR